MKDDQLLAQAKRDIERLFGDRSRSREATLEALEELREDLDIRIEALQWDIEQAERQGDE
jgi:uncharacterized protein Yka (UPF0111/DUF47 family)